MKVTEYTVYLELPDTAQVGDTLEIVGTGRVTKVAEKVSTTWSARTDLTTFEFGERSAKVSLNLRPA